MAEPWVCPLRVNEPLGSARLDQWMHPHCERCDAGVYRVPGGWVHDDPNAEPNRRPS